MIRKFRLTNGAGDGWDLNSRSSFFHSIAGLGFKDGTQYEQVGTDFIPLEELFSQGEMSGRILFGGAAAYQTYRAFSRFVRAVPLTLIYQTDETYRVPVRLTELSKGELMEGGGGLVCDVAFLATGLFYKSVTRQSGVLSIGGKVYPYTYSYSYAIAKALTADGIPTPSGKKKWGASVIESILTNEKYKGAALLQKCYTVDFLSKKRKVNEGEVQQYWIERSHQPIIQPHEFDVVQAEFARRKGMGLHYSGGGVFASRLVCGDCGGYYGPKVWHSNSKYRRVVWQCNGKFRNEEKCSTPHLMEEDIKARFLAAFNQLLEGKDVLLEDCRIMQDHLTNCSAIDAELDELLREIAVVTELTQRCIQENARSAQSQEEYAERYNGYVARYEKAKARVDALQEQKKQRQAEADLIGGFMFALHEREAGITEFDNSTWLAVVQKATAYHDRRLVFTFQNGMEIEG